MRIILLISFFVLALFANELEPLSSTKKQIIELKKQQIKQKETSNKYDWLTDINLNSQISKDDENIKSENHSISISQDIFKFGGIKDQIDYASELKKLESLDLEISTKEDLNTIFSLLIDTKLDDINLEQNRLNLLNNEIDIRHKKSEYKAGEIGISDLNEVIMNKNTLKDTQKELQLSKLVNINSIKQYTNKKYASIQIPDIQLLDKKTFLEKSLEINYARKNIDVTKLLYEIKKTDYLPTLSVTGNYGYSKSDIVTGDDYYNYGIQVSIPLSFTTSSDITQTKIDYLISKQELEEQINNIELNYNETLLNINNYKDRISLALDDIKLYNELIFTNEEEYKAGYKTIDDVEALQNSKLIRQLDIQSFNLQIKKLIFTLYFQISQ